MGEPAAKAAEPPTLRLLRDDGFKESDAVVSLARAELSEALDCTGDGRLTFTFSLLGTSHER